MNNELPTHEEETTPQASSSMKDSVLETIKTNAAPMRSQLYFILKIVGLVFATLAVLILSVAICNFIFFSLRINQPSSFLLSGLPGFWLFLALFPWWLLLLDIVFIILLEWLLRQFRFGYKSPLVYLLLGTLIIVVAISAFIDRGTSLNDDLIRQADRHQLPPPVGMFIESQRHALPIGSGFFKGKVVSLSGNTVIISPLGTTTSITVILDPHDPIIGTLRTGDVIFFEGDPATTTVHARGIQKLPSDALPTNIPPPH